jgi:hypothetical protein
MTRVNTLTFFYFFQIDRLTDYHLNRPQKREVEIEMKVVIEDEMKVDFAIYANQHLQLSTTINNNQSIDENMLITIYFRLVI